MAYSMVSVETDALGSTYFGIVDYYKFVSMPCDNLLKPTWKGLQTESWTELSVIAVRSDAVEYLEHKQYSCGFRALWGSLEW
jgi:hypothetical protein